ncbi:MAG: aspartate-semialdehyde dehydrogenase [Armatimonadota bacterium]
MGSGYHVAIAGATGAVGTEFLRVLESHSFPVASLRLLASERSEGKKLRFRGEEITVQRMTENSFAGVQIAFFSAGASRSRQFAPAAVKAGAVLIDNSSAFRMDPQVPLVVPEINLEDAREHKGIIANPNCSTIIMLMAVAPLQRLSRVRRVVVSTYQSASGAGAQAMQELIDQTAAILEGKAVTPRVLPHQIAFNLFSHNSAINEWGYNEEEWKMIHESRKILHEPNLAITATCVRVPVLRAHSESINIEFADRRPSVDEAREALQAFPGVRVVDDRKRNHFPMPIEASEREEVLVGRIREDVSNPMALDLFVSGDQLLKGAALNAVQIAEGMIAKGWL